MSREQAGAISPEVREQIQEVIARIDGEEIASELLDLAKIGGTELEPTPDHPVHIGTNRLALTEADVTARRTFTERRMRRAGMSVLNDHPLASIGVYPGQHESLAPVVALSHTDTVPNGDIYDGTLGVLGPIKTASIMRELGIYPERDVMVVDASIEESSRFGSALMGSRALWHGLTVEELDAHKDGGPSIREVLGQAGVERAMVPEFKPKGHMLAEPYALVELHVEQDSKLIDSGIDLGVVNRIASPVRYRATAGDSELEPDNESYAYERYYRLTVHGKPDHSGATPMGFSDRADSLLETADILQRLFSAQGGSAVLSVGSIEVEDAAMNKIPGTTATTLRLAADSERTVDDMYDFLGMTLEKREVHHRAVADHFPDSPFELERIEKSEAGTFFAHREMARRQQEAVNLIQSVNLAARNYMASGVVGTVASWTTSPEGIISLDVDIRGIDLSSRDQAVEHIRQNGLDFSAFGTVALGEPLPGSGSAPVELDSSLVDTALDTIDEFGIGTRRRMFSAAGHDTQNAARAGVPSVMIFAQSKDGIAHNPNAYTSPENIGKAVKAQAALLLRLANEVSEFE